MEINKVYLGDCIEISRSFPDESIDLVFADPPYNIGKKYADNYNDKMKQEEYINWSKQWIGEMYRVLKKNGSIYIAINDENAPDIAIILRELGFFFRNWIIWYYTAVQGLLKKFSRSHTIILYYTKNKNNFIFNRDAVSVPQRNDPQQKTVLKDVWLIGRILGNFPERILGHPTQMPEALLERIIKASSNEGDIVLDPFGGTGTTAAVAKKLGRNFITIERAQEYYELILQRLNGNGNGKRPPRRKKIIEKKERQLPLFFLH